MDLTRKELSMVRGDEGPGVKRCMDILIKFGDAMGATSMLPIVSAHTMPKEPPELLHEMTDGAKNTGVPTTLHPMMSAFNPNRWVEMGLPEDFVSCEMKKYEKRMEIYRRCGFKPTYSCLPMFSGNLPLKGEPVSWVGSGAQILSNSLLGARCNRDGAVISLASAMTGVAPRYGMFLEENRLADVVVRFKDVAPEELSFAQLGAVGYHVGALAGGGNVVFDGVPEGLDIDHLKYLMAPLAVSGSVCMCHVVGITPEAPTLDAATGGRKPQLSISVGSDDIRDAFRMYSADLDHVDMAVFGCPHFSIEEAASLAGMLSETRLSPGKRLWLGMGAQMYDMAKDMGIAEAIEGSGGIITSSCVATVSDAPLPKDVRVVATNSFKAAHYITRLTKGRVRAVVADVERCIQAVTKKTAG